MKEQLERIDRFHKVMRLTDQFIDFCPLLKADVESGFWDNNMYKLLILNLEIMFDNSLCFERQTINVALENFKDVRELVRSGDYNLAVELIRIAKRHIELFKKRLSDYENN